MPRLTAMLVLLVLLGAAGCSVGPHDKSAEGCADQAALCHQPPDHSSSGSSGNTGNGGGMGHGMM
ncbi:MAG TPA: hypothetical protein VLA85_13625 [Verrucomicrobiae bacterium]|nr:hypothetical protein [Verrucomicrobiae bacterium]